MAELVECARLEIVYTGNCIEGSNPPISAIYLCHMQRIMLLNEGYTMNQRYFDTNKTYTISRRGYRVTLRYLLDISTKDGGKTAHIFGGIHDGGTNKDEHLFFALHDGRYATSPQLEKALQKLWSGKTNVLHAISSQKQVHS